MFQYPMGMLVTMGKSPSTGPTADREKGRVGTSLRKVKNQAGMQKRPMAPIAVKFGHFHHCFKMKRMQNIVNYA